LQHPIANCEDTSGDPACTNCGKLLRAGRAFAFRPRGAASGEGVSKCLWCASRHAPMLRRSAVVAVVVGTVLTALNQGDNLVSGQWNNALYWKIPLTYCVPFLVATYGALTAARR
jgi:hypothetical protein